MADRELVNMDDAELGELLRALGRQRSYPPTPDLAPAVHARIRARSGATRRQRAWPLAMVAAALVALLCVGALAFPGARSTVAGWLNLPGVTFFAETVGDRPVLGGALRLGEPVTLAEARERVLYPLLVPDLPWLGDPDEVYLDAEPAGGTVSFIYHAGGEIPPAETTGVGLLLSQFQGQVNPGMYGKGLPDGVELEYLEINGHVAFWISGEPHTFSYFRPDGQPVQETSRLAGNTLLWQHGGLTLRLESGLDRDQAVEIAESMR
ncbi:MAG TPA: hypothetical protein VMM78_02035 [Thermomicrobiales bacterium]|nr:hypothetical protein [Thermomicrobiales bacterium]